MSKTFNNLGTLEEMMNGLRLEASLDYQNRVPELTKENFKEFSTGVLSKREIMNEWANNLINRIGLTIINQRVWNNPLAVLKKGMVEHGDTVQEIYRDIIQAQEYEPFTSSKDAGKIYASAIPPIYAIYHNVNREHRYDISMNHKELRKAFISPQTLESFIGSIYTTVANSDNVDEFLMTKQLLTNYDTNGLFAKIQVNKVTDENSAKQLITKVKEYSNKLTFMSRKYNAFNVANHTKKEEQVIFISSELDAIIDVNVLATAFNMDKTSINQRKIVLDEMPVPNCELIVVSRDFFQIWDTFISMENLWNPSTLEWKYFYHHHSILSTSRFENAIAFVSSKVNEPKTIELTRATNEVLLPYNSTKLNVVVKDKDGKTDGVSQSVLYAVSGASSKDTRVDGNGMLSIGLTETAKKISVIAVALGYGEVTGELDVEIGVQTP